MWARVKLKFILYKIHLTFYGIDNNSYVIFYNEVTHYFCTF